MSFILLYIEFFKIGVFAVGGGLATLPFLFNMANDIYSFIRQANWISTEQISNFIAIAQCSPGAIGVNVAVQTGYQYGLQTGYQYGGIAGGILAALGLICPAVIVISAIAKTLQSIKDKKITVRIFSGLRPAAAGLLAAAGWGVCLLAFYNSKGIAWHEIFLWPECLISLTIFILIIKFNWHPIIYIAIGAAAGIAMGFL